MPVLPKCVNPNGARYCVDPNCPARDAQGIHLVPTTSSNDLTSISTKGLPSSTIKAKKPIPTTTSSFSLEKPKPHESDMPLFDLNEEWMGATINFYIKAAGAESVFYASPSEESTIVARIESSGKRDIYIIAKGHMRIKYNNHIIRSSQQLINIGITSDARFQKAATKNIIEVLQTPKFEAVDIRYLGRKDETRTPILPVSTNMASLIFEVVKYFNN
jgi:hypothetical protein